MASTYRLASKAMVPCTMGMAFIGLGSIMGMGSTVGMGSTMRMGSTVSMGSTVGMGSTMGVGSTMSLCFLHAKMRVAKKEMMLVMKGKIAICRPVASPPAKKVFNIRYNFSFRAVFDNFQFDCTVTEPSNDCNKTDLLRRHFKKLTHYSNVS